MAILRDGQDDWFLGGLDTCFLCSEPLAKPIIHWVGGTGPIAFHPDCARSFILRLGRDCWEYFGDA